MREKKTNNRKLILFIHGLGGSEETWGKFPLLIEEDKASHNFDVEFFPYKTSLLRMRSLASVSGKILGFILPNSWASKVASFLSFLVPQQRLPKIQHIAKQLQTWIEDYADEYDEIYFIAHSMGGLVTRRYLYNMIKAQNILKVKKVMLYAVPNNGSNWAKLSAIYAHEQIAQLEEVSDFLELLNEEIDTIKFEEYVDTLYVVGDEDEVVPRSSAKSYHGNSQVKYLPKGHLNIVKPESHVDSPYKVFSNFILKDEFSPREIEEIALSQEAKASPFVKEVFGSLFTIKPLMVLYYQEFTTITKEKNYLKEQAFHTFKNNMYEIVIPSCKDEKAYFSYLAKVCGMSNSVDSVDQWRDAFDTRLKNKERFLLLVSEVDEGERELNKLFANGIRALQTSYANLFVLFIGRKKLAYMVHGENEFSPLNGAVELFFSNRERYLPKEKALAILKECKDDCDLLCTDIGVEWSVYPNTRVIRKLFWKNLLKKEENSFVWYDKATEALAKNCCGCEDVV